MKSRRRRLFAILRGWMDGGDLMKPPAAVVCHFQGLGRLDQGDQKSGVRMREMVDVVWSLKPGSTPLKPSTDIKVIETMRQVYLDSQLSSLGFV